VNGKKKMIIIGGGPGGYVAAIRAAQLGAEVHVIEENRVGGTCLNVGCIPTKALLHTAKIFHHLKDEEKNGLIIDSSSVDMDALMARKQQVVNRLVGGVEGLFKANSITLHKGHAVIKADKSVIIDNKETLKGDAVVLALGSRPVVIPFAGHNLPGVIDSTEALDLKELPSAMVIMGGGVIGIEFAYLFNALGVKVTIVELQPRILPTIDEEITKILQKEFTAMGIEIKTNAKLLSAQQENHALAVLVEENGQTSTLSCDKLLVAVGRTPNTAGMQLEQSGISMNRAAIAVDSNYMTSVRDVYAIGDCNGKIMLAHAASAQGIDAVEHIMGHKVTRSGDIVPSCVYTFPEIGAVGQTEEQLREAGTTYQVGRFPMAGNGKALIEGTESGLVKILTGARYGEVLGMHIIGSNATDLIAEGTLAISAELTAADLVAAIHPHPTISEAVMEAAHDVLDGAIHWPPSRKK